MAGTNHAYMAHTAWWMGWTLGTAMTGSVAAQTAIHTSPAAAAVERGFNARPELAEETYNGWYPSLELMYRHHDNVFRRPDPEKRSDNVWSIRPAVLYRTNVGRHQAQLYYGVSLERYDEFDSEDTTDHGGSGVITFDLSEKLEADIFAERQDTHEPRGTSASRLASSDEIVTLASGPDEFEVTRYGGELTYGRRENRMQLSLGAIAGEWRFTNNDQEGRDRDEDRVFGTVYYNLGPRTSLFVRGAWDDIDFLSPASDLDSEEFGYYLGLRWEASEATTGEVGIGRIEKDFDSPRRDDTETGSYFGRVIWQPKPFSTVRVHASKSLEETTDLNSDFIDTRLIGMSWDHGLTDRWAFFVYLNQTRDKFSDGRRDTLKDYGAGLDYAFRSWLTFGGSYGRFERDSNFPEAEFEDRIFSLYVRFRYFLGGSGF